MHAIRSLGGGLLSLVRSEFVFLAGRRFPLSHNDQLGLATQEGWAVWALYHADDTATERFNDVANPAGSRECPAPAQSAAGRKLQSGQAVNQAETKIPAATDQGGG
jgi:hypothetical protein